MIEQRVYPLKHLLCCVLSLSAPSSTKNNSSRIKPTSATLTNDYLKLRFDRKSVGGRDQKYQSSSTLVSGCADVGLISRRKQLIPWFYWFPGITRGSALSVLAIVRWSTTFNNHMLCNIFRSIFHIFPFELSAVNSFEYFAFISDPKRLLYSYDKFIHYEKFS
jgi:hypothetical protein